MTTFGRGRRSRLLDRTAEAYPDQTLQGEQKKMTNLLQVLILVCSVDQAPQDCGPDTALDVIVGPAAANEIACARDGQAYVAGTPFVVAGLTWPKILCARALGEGASAPRLAARSGPLPPGEPHGH
jgi:hypothetical protein